MTSARVSWAKVSHMAVPNLRGGKEVLLSYVSPSRSVDTIVMVPADQRNFTKALKNQKTF